MEETVWIIIGVLSVILTFGIIANLIVTNQQETKFTKVESALEKMKAQCDFVCNSPEGTLLSANVDLPSGLVLTSNETVMCGSIKDKLKCVSCTCSITGEKLNLTLAERFFYTHAYSCYFKRLKNGIQLECQG